MGFKIPCPNCGLRDAYEFRFGYESKKAPHADADLRTWREYLYFFENTCGIQEEWWCHSAGCGAWFKVKRDTSTNEILTE